MVAAIAAARRGAAVTVLERMPRVGKKLLATGNGRCNFANAHLELRPLPRAGPRIRRRGARGVRPRGDTRLLPGPRRRAARGGGRQDLPALGPGLRRPRRAAPRTGAPRRRDALRGRGHAPGAAARRRGRSPLRGETLRCGAVVLASGGRASPQLGSNGSGYELVRPLGHRLVPPFPALTRIRVASPFLKHLKGVKIEGVASLVPQGRDRPRGERCLTTRRAPRPARSSSPKPAFRVRRSST